MNIIIRETSSEMRAIARKALRGNWKNFAIIMALYYLLMITLPLLIDANENVSEGASKQRKMGKRVKNRR